MAHHATMRRTAACVTETGPIRSGWKTERKKSYTRHVDQITVAGQSAYELPIYANVAFNRPGKALIEWHRDS